MRYSLLHFGGIILLFLTACGPSQGQIATMTASAWTPTLQPTATSEPTATSTPIPYDLTISVVDEAGVPVAGAQVIFPESGIGDAVTLDASGKFSWTNLPGAETTLNVTAQGYLPGQEKATLERGPSEISIVMKRDPYGLLPSTACAAGEKLLFMEDFQNGTTNLAHYDNGPSAVPLGPAPDEPGNTVIIHDFTNPKVDYSSYLDFNPPGSPIKFGEAAWRFRFMVTEESTWNLSWNSAGPNEFGGITTSNTWYRIGFEPNRHLTVWRQILDANGQAVTNLGRFGLDSKVLVLKPGEWHYIEISTFQGHLQIWLDGIVVIDTQDDMPLPPGGFSFQGASGGIQYFDAVSVCGLSAPFTSILAPVPLNP